ncbi:beta-fructofuranosidase, insoluble isoenzyme 5-like [Phragmites australis]|uniref:beta-fructofuranosidase, insoluble isoenzyme 5-like n=1 Tax=Phragmites australis TaxID=29695 RepID=UPI002D79231F|nr:beta-fructofuranosidase, insoluble isoenzyme 5-like [Phragmites australis]
MNGEQQYWHHGRTAYHFQPAKNWMNDPNGPLYHNGVYHLFYQYNPHGPLFDTGRLSWGHSVSGDLVNWAFLGTALDPTSPFDADGCWSGSVTVLSDGRPIILYTGRDSNRVQVQNVAFPKNPSDPLLREWHKPSCNPVIPQPADVTGNNFRDPTTAWLGHDGQWRFAVAAEVEGVGSTLIYRSADFVHWKRNATPLHTSPDVPVWECPDLFPVAKHGTEGLDTSANGPGVWHVLKLSKAADEDYYVVGRYDDETDTFVPGDGNDVRNWRRVDHGHLFGAKSFFDARKNRRVLWAWVNETDNQSDDVAKGWTGIQAFPRALWLDSDGKQLVQWPVEEIETLRRKRVVLLGAVVASGGLHEIAGIETRQADVEVVFEMPNLEEAETFDPNWLQDPQKLCAEKDASVQGGVGPFGLIVMASGDMQEQTTIFFRLFKHDDAYKVLMCTDLTRSSTKEEAYKPVYGGFVDVDVAKDKCISLRTLIDHSVIESFGGGGRTCITARVYPEHAATGSSHLYVFNNGSDVVKVSKLEAWELGTASVNVEDDGLVALQSPLVVPMSPNRRNHHVE